MTHEERLEKLYRMLKARTNHKGEPLPNFGPNVAAIKAEIAKLEERSTYAGIEWPEGS